MLVQYILLFFAAVITAIIGALPFGLVNLSVLEISLSRGYRPAMNLASGASIIEVFFALVSILAGSMLNQYVEGNRLVGIIAMLVLVAGGFYFLFRKAGIPSISKTRGSAFYRGILLNLISIQVLLFWILAVTYLSSREFMKYDTISVFMFLAGVWSGKILTLFAYSRLSMNLLNRSRVISGNINRIIGFVLITMAFIQFFRI